MQISWIALHIILGLSGLITAIYGFVSAVSKPQKITWLVVSLTCVLIIASISLIIGSWLFVPLVLSWLVLTIILIVNRRFSTLKSKIFPIYLSLLFALTSLGMALANPHYLFHFAIEIIPQTACFYSPANVVNVIRLPERGGVRELYESVVALPDGRFVVVTSSWGELLLVTAEGEVSTLTTLPKGDFKFTLGGMSGLLGAIVLGKDGAIYASVGSTDPSNNGIWRVTLDGVSERWIALPDGALSNGITIDENGDFYMADSAMSLIWKADSEGGEPEIWYEDLPQGTLNGLKWRDGQIFFTNTIQRRVVRVDVSSDGSAGAAAVLATGIGGDDFDIDSQGSLYITTHPYNTVVKLAEDEACMTIANENEMIFGATSAVFGVRPDDRHILYVLTDGGYSKPERRDFPAIIALEVD